MERRLVSTRAIIGEMAKWAVVQHPFHSPPRLAEVTYQITEHVKTTFTDGIESHPMRWFTGSQEILAWLREALLPCEGILQHWNTPASGHGSPHVFTSRYGGPAPEDDFIDIDALLGNVALGVWRDAEEYSEKAA